MKTRKDLKQAYRERPKQAGVFQIKNSVTGKLLLGSSLNLDGPLNRHKFQLSLGKHPNKALQDDWNTYGPDVWLFEILEVVKVTDDPYFKLSDELALLEQIWLEQLQPFGERGYNSSSDIRQA